MSEYTVAKSSKLRLKGESKAPKKKKKKTGNDSSAASLVDREAEEDMTKHGGWWGATNFEEIGSTVAVEFGNQTYMLALDNGLFTLGAPHKDGEPPSPEEIFTAIKINDNKIALKSGYGKYIKVEKTYEVVGRSDAVGAPEQWETVFEGKKMALLGSNGCFMSMASEDDSIVASARKVGPNEVIRLRCQIVRADKNEGVPTEEQAINIRQIEINYVKKFQKFQDKRMRIAEPDDLEMVKKAKVEGYLHETLLDRRSKMKADRYCK